MTTMHDQLRADTCQLLRYDIANLTPAQEVRLERALVLRLEIDDLTSRKLASAGLPFDVKSFVAASESLELLVGGDPEQASPTDDFADAKEELNRFLVERAERVEARDLKLRDEIARLVEENAKLQAKLRAAEEQQPSRSDNVIQIDATARANATKPPAHYLRDGQPREAWRDCTRSPCRRGRCPDKGGDVSNNNNNNNYDLQLAACSASLVRCAIISRSCCATASRM